MKNLVKKICEGFRATLYPCPETITERRDVAASIKVRIDDLNTILQRSQTHRNRVLKTVAMNIKCWIKMVLKIKATYVTLNMFDLEPQKRFLVAEGWLPTVFSEELRQAFERGTV